MRIEMSAKEFRELRDSIVALNDSKVNRVFNAIFGRDHIQEITLNVDKDTKDVMVLIPEENSVKFFTVLKRHLREIGILLKGGLNPLGIPKWKRTLTSFGEDIIRVFR